MTSYLGPEEDVLTKEFLNNGRENPDYITITDFDAIVGNIHEHFAEVDGYNAKEKEFMIFQKQMEDDVLTGVQPYVQRELVHYPGSTRFICCVMDRGHQNSLTFLIECNGENWDRCAVYNDFHPNAQSFTIADDNLCDLIDQYYEFKKTLSDLRLTFSGHAAEVKSELVCLYRSNPTFLGWAREWPEGKEFFMPVYEAKKEAMTNEAPVEVIKRLMGQV